jgi:hypothetical protein
VATRVTGGTHPGISSRRPDHLESLNVLTNGTGVEVLRLTYLPYGETASNDHMIDFLQHRFTSQEQVPETGLYYYGARHSEAARDRSAAPDSDF